MRSLGIHVCELEVHRRVIRTHLSACVANSIRESPVAIPIYCIGIGTVVRCIHKERVVAVNIHSAASRSSPSKAHDPLFLRSGADRS